MTIAFLNLVDSICAADGEPKFAGEKRGWYSQLSNGWCFDFGLARFAGHRPIAIELIGRLHIIGEAKLHHLAAVGD